MEEDSDANGSQDCKHNSSKDEAFVPTNRYASKECDAIDTKQGKEASENILPLCYVCVDKEADGVIMPCGHGGICFRCGLILARKVGEKICPICRSKIGQVLKLMYVLLNRRLMASCY